MATIVSIPASRARAIICSRSASNCSISRCAWESTKVGRWSLVISRSLCGDRRVAVRSVVEDKKLGLFKSRSHRHILEETRQHSLAAFRRRGHNHSVRFQSPKLSGRKVRHDYHFPPDQQLRRVRFGDSSHNLANLSTQVDFQAEQFVCTLHFLRRFDLPYAQFDLREIIDADLAIRHGRGRLRCRRWSRGSGGGRSCHRRWCCVGLRFSRLSAASLFFHLLHPFNCALVGARKYRLNIAQLRSQLELSPLQLRERKLANITQAN